MKYVKVYTPVIYLIVMLVFWMGCDNATKQNDSKEEKPQERQFISIGTAPIGGAFHPVGSAIANVVSKNMTEKDWEVTAEGTKGTQENIRLLVSKDSSIEFGLANAAISYFAFRGEGAWNTIHSIRSVMTLAPNVGLFVTTKSSGITSLADLKGRRVVVGPAGAGFEYFLSPILAAHGVKYEDFKPLNATYNSAVDYLADGSADAAFMGGAIPTPAVTRASSNQDIVFIPFDDSARKSLIEDYPFFTPITIPADAYSKVLTEPFETINVGSMQLITAESADEDMVYNFTKTVYTHRAEVVTAHPAGKAINETNAVRDVGTPFHLGAIRFYKEIGIWKE